MVTLRSWPWSWMVNAHPFRSMSISPPIPETRLFQTLTLRLQGQNHGYGKKKARPHCRLSIWFVFSCHINHLYFLCPKNLRSNSNGLTFVEAAVAAEDAAVETNWKHKATPDRLTWLPFHKQSLRCYAINCVFILMNFISRSATPGQITN